MLSYVEQAESLRRRLPELSRLEEIIPVARRLGQVAVEAEVAYKGLTLPMYSFAFGSDRPSDPTLAFIGGVHGLERIGTNVVLSYLATACELLQWDAGFQYLLKRCRLLFMPLVNPAGMYARTRSNGNGVDLMRNAPVDAEEKPNVLLVGGHRMSPALPWYRGKAGAMELEAATLMRFINSKVKSDSFTFTLDVHSGFGVVDRMWFPYAKSRRPFENIAEAYALKDRLDQTLPHHVYRIEPQSHHYLTHGDLWDYLYSAHREAQKDGVFLPFCLEMGSWVWVKKNPRQLFTMLGMFNPVLPHRYRRTLRRQVFFMDFLVRLVASYQNWLPPGEARRNDFTHRGMELWYPAATRRNAV